MGPSEGQHDRPADHNRLPGHGDLPAGGHDPATELAAVAQQTRKWNVGFTAYVVVLAVVLFFILWRLQVDSRHNEDQYRQLARAFAELERTQQQVADETRARTLQDCQQRARLNDSIVGAWRVVINFSGPEAAADPRVGDFFKALDAQFPKLTCDGVSSDSPVIVPTPVTTTVPGTVPPTLPSRADALPTTTVAEEGGGTQPEPEPAPPRDTAPPDTDPAVTDPPVTDAPATDPPPATEATAITEPATTSPPATAPVTEPPTTADTTPPTT